MPQEFPRELHFNNNAKVYLDKDNIFPVEKLVQNATYAVC